MCYICISIFFILVTAQHTAHNYMNKSNFLFLPFVMVLLIVSEEHITRVLLPIKVLHFHFSESLEWTHCTDCMTVNSLIRVTDHALKYINVGVLF